MSQDVASIEELIARARAGDRVAMARLLEWSAPLLEGRASRRLKRRQPDITRPSDIVQEASDRASRAMASFRGTTAGEWLSWLESIVEACAAQSFRDAARKKRDRAGEIPLDDDKLVVPQLSPSRATADVEQWRQVLGQIYELPEDQRNAIWLRYLKDLSVPEVAQCMGRTEAAIRGLLDRGTDTLRERLTSGSAEDGAPRATQAQEAARDALLVYQRRRDAGERVDAVAFIAEHPSCAAELRDMIAWIERLEALRLTSRED
ncbi:sigma-70 family RNA polymerase sigma factor [Sorangium sp. So ce131]|uniref:sigma-70 family RNA polymerase sigma factor n=1 Tax=Sorangium sp. So ce131 TaxID=3133282 RepID=UPI003F5FB1ED